MVALSLVWGEAVRAQAALAAEVTRVLLVLELTFEGMESEKACALSGTRPEVVCSRRFPVPPSIIRKAKCELEPNRTDRNKPASRYLSMVGLCMRKCVDSRPQFFLPLRDFA